MHIYFEAAINCSNVTKHKKTPPASVLCENPTKINKLDENTIFFAIRILLPNFAGRKAVDGTMFVRTINTEIEKWHLFVSGTSPLLSSVGVFFSPTLRDFVVN